MIRRNAKMAVTTKQFVVELAFEDDQPANAPKPYIKDWWAEHHLEEAIVNHLPTQNSKIHQVTVSLKKVELLREFTYDICKKLEGKE